MVSPSEYDSSGPPDVILGIVIEKGRANQITGDPQANLSREKKVCSHSAAICEAIVANLCLRKTRHVVLQKIDRD